MLCHSIKTRAHNSDKTNNVFLCQYIHCIYEIGLSHVSYVIAKQCQFALDIIQNRAHYYRRNYAL